MKLFYSFKSSFNDGLDFGLSIILINLLDRFDFKKFTYAVGICRDPISAIYVKEIYCFNNLHVKVNYVEATQITLGY